MPDPSPVPPAAPADPITGVRRLALGASRDAGLWSVRSGSLPDDAPDGVAGRPIPAEVPGCAHTDLLASGLIEDPYVERHDEACDWVSRADWVFSRRFDANRAEPGERVELVCEGIDTIAAVRVNGVEVGRADNMHLAYRFDVGPVLRDGENELEIEVSAPRQAAERLAAEHGPLPIGGLGTNPPRPHNAIRKMACSYGWDWGPALTSSGVWRPIGVERWRGARIAGVRPLILEAEPEAAQVEARVDVEFDGACASAGLTAVLIAPDGREVASARGEASASAGGGRVEMTVVRPRLWWPAGYGEQPLYTLEVRLDAGDGAGNGPGDVWSGRVGMRTVELVREPEPGAADERSELFFFRVNGRRVFCKGANWIPDDCFPARVTRERARRRVEQAARANMNMLRVWGGGLYESHDFYDACDELGVLVWQDFLCACAAYHEGEPYRSWLEAEARRHVARLCRHPSLVVWCGNNECVEAVEGWAEFEPLREDPSIPWGRSHYERLFPSVVAELDPTRPYWPGSGHSTVEGDAANDERSGDVHIWDVWNRGKSGYGYLAHRPKFASEFGFHGPPAWPTLERSIPEGERRFDSASMRHHNRHAGGQALANTRMADFFDPPASFDDWLYAAQVVQARALEVGCEWFRALSPVCSGALYWQLNDCWPVASWSAIDGDGRPKPLWYATRRFFRPRLATIRPAEPTSLGAACPELAVYLHNDSDAEWRGELAVETRSVVGEAKQTVREASFEVGPRGTWRSVLPELVLERDEFLVARAGHERAFWFPHPDRDMPYPAASIEWSMGRSGDAHRMLGVCRTPVRDLCVFAERLDPEAEVSEQLITALPGDTIEVVVRCPRELSLADLTAPPVLQTANRFGARGRSR